MTRRRRNGSVGELVSGIDLKLSDGDEGEVLVKSPVSHPCILIHSLLTRTKHMFSKYLYDPEATAQAHDEEGYYRTGDIARREGKYYYIVGRASLDIIKSGGYKISALDIERELLGLPYIAEAMVVGVADEEFGQRVAALVSLQEEEMTDSFLQTYGNNEYLLTLEDVRRGPTQQTCRIQRYRPCCGSWMESYPRQRLGRSRRRFSGHDSFPFPAMRYVQRCRSGRRCRRWQSCRYHTHQHRQCS